MLKRLTIALIVLSAPASAAAVERPDLMIRMATGSVSQTICSKTFVSGLQPDEIYAQDMRPEPGMGLLDWALRYDVDRDRKEVRTTVMGLFESRAVHLDGFGCVLLHGDDPPIEPGPSAPAGGDDGAPAPSSPDSASAAPAEATEEPLRGAIDAAFMEPAEGAQRWTQAVVVVHGGRVIAERYAPGFGVETPLLSHSIAKSVINALMGILVRKGDLSVTSAAPVAAWQAEGDPRHAVTIDELLRMTSGLPLDEGIGPGPSQQMWFVERDSASFAEKASLVTPPGSTWAYSNLGYAILSRIVARAIGGSPRDVAAFARRELFRPLGMRDVTIEFDAAGTPMGANAIFATARDWARFGLLYLNDGVVGDRRILPEGWVAYSTRQTLDTGYGAGFWLNTVSTPIPEWRTPWGLPGAPRDAFMARGYLGQYVVVVPSEDLVVVRFGASHAASGNLEGVGALVRDVIAALPRPTPAP